MSRNEPLLTQVTRGPSGGFCKPFTPCCGLALPLCAQVSKGLSGGLSRPQASDTEGPWRERTAQYWKAALEMALAQAFALEEMLFKICTIN